MNEYQRKANTNKKMESIEDMKRFMQEFPEFRKMGGNVSKHVMLVSHLSRLVDDQLLLEVSEVEQELAAVEDHPTAIQVRARTPAHMLGQAGTDTMCGADGVSYSGQCQGVGTQQDPRRPAVLAAVCAAPATLARTHTLPLWASPRVCLTPQLRALCRQ